MIIALTHMSISSDRDLLEKVPDIDIAFGGHDHHLVAEKVTFNLWSCSWASHRERLLTVAGYSNILLLIFILIL